MAVEERKAQSLHADTADGLAVFVVDAADDGAGRNQPENEVLLLLAGRELEQLARTVRDLLAVSHAKVAVAIHPEVVFAWLEAFQHEAAPWVRAHRVRTAVGPHPLRGDRGPLQGLARRAFEHRSFDRARGLARGFGLLSLKQRC